ncbi:M1 family metallopeptidase [Dinghuibacter silviterrae]|uniref:Aminopeptidase N n=1 Tax=Dinghuibacter silviterrae TaxID=1539049 RepID=A0A4R8DJL1_9BACT|nr:M1 family aminopeptidase [Dinghuibacter silviterrae]TDW97504.1 aminopeptidase N [Dinghuibacter silviterrae]
MRTTILFLLWAVPALGDLHRPPVAADTVAPGVSLRLAQERAHRLKDIRYTLAFHIPEEQAGPAPGNEDLSSPVTGEEDLDFVCLDTRRPLQLDFKAARDQVGAMTVNGHRVTPDLRMEHLVIAARDLIKGHNHLHLTFTAGNRPLNRNREFLYTLLVPDRARELFPCFDQPDLKAVFKLRLTLPEGWRAIANGRAAAAGRAAAGGRAAVDGNAPEKAGAAAAMAFAPSDKLPTYLFSFAAGRFKDSVRTSSHGPVEALYRETDTAKVRLSLDTLFRQQEDALKYLETYTGLPYPFQKFGFVAIPDFQFGGMEHPGAIQYKASALFLDDAATLDQRNARANVLSHETAHIWFGDLVTMRWFNDVWMKEVFANFMADKITRTDDYDLRFLTEHLPAAYAVDRTEGTNPIRQPLDNLQDAGSLYGNIIYHKAPVMMRQLELQMGEEPFRDGVRDYLKTFAYGNATWPDLLRCLQRYTTMDLTAWNQVWVNETGRPVFSCTYDTSGDVIKKLTLSQKGEDGSSRVWPQVIDVALGYNDHIDTLRFTMKTAHTELSWKDGLPKPRYILFNTLGLGYGVFPMYGNTIPFVAGAQNRVIRASTYINAYENMLDGQGLTPFRFVSAALTNLLLEHEELNMGLLLGQISSCYWHFLSPLAQRATGKVLEIALWQAINGPFTPAERKLLFLNYAGIARSKAAEDSVFKVWNTQHPPQDIKLSEDDYTNLAAGLALRGYPGSDTILAAQGRRIKSPDRQARWAYLQPALSPDQAVRDKYFYALKDAQNRTKEAWVLSALGYLFHPLRADQDEKYLASALDWMEDIQRTGDVFFPQSWAAAVLSNYSSKSAAKLVRDFLKEHPDYNPRLKGKILQAADNLFRAQRLESAPKLEKLGAVPWH